MASLQQRELDRALYNECSRVGTWMYEQVELLIKLGANPNAEFTVCDSPETTLTAIFVAHDPLRLLELLIKSGADMNQLSERAMKTFVKRLRERNSIFNEVLKLHRKYPSKINLCLIYLYELSLGLHYDFSKLNRLIYNGIDPKIIRGRTIIIKSPHVFNKYVRPYLCLETDDNTIIDFRRCEKDHGHFENMITTIFISYQQVKVIIDEDIFFKCVESIIQCDRLQLGLHKLTNDFVHEVIPVRLLQSIHEIDPGYLISKAVEFTQRRQMNILENSKWKMLMNMPYNLLRATIDLPCLRSKRQVRSLSGCVEIMNCLKRLNDTRSTRQHLTYDSILMQIFNNPNYRDYATVKLEPQHYHLLVPPHFNVIKTVTEIRSLCSTVWSLIPNEIMFEIFSMIVC